MATQLLNKCSPIIIQAARGLVPRYKSFSPPTFLAYSTPRSYIIQSQILPRDPSAHKKSHFSTTSTAMADSKAFLQAVESRRTYYALSNESPISDARIKELVAFALKHTPSPFNSQTSRLVVVLKEEHVKLWNIIMDVYKNMLPEDKFQHAKGRMEGFRTGYGTVLFYEDTSNVREFQEKFKTYEDKFPAWSDHTNGMMQYVIWTALEAEGLGVNLQHYNPPIDPRLETEYNVPPTWSLKAQMVFGKPVGEPMPKQFKPLDERMKVFE